MSVPGRSLHDTARVRTGTPVSDFFHSAGFPKEQIGSGDDWMANGHAAVRPENAGRCGASAYPSLRRSLPKGRPSSPEIGGCYRNPA